jgi:hypothetical protein
MLAEERALTSGALWTKPRIGDWRQPGTPLSIRTLLKRLYPAAKTAADLVLLGAFAIARCFDSAHQLSVAAVCREVKPVGKPDAGNPHVRFDERGRETERCRMAPSHRARPRLYVRPDGAVYQWRKVPPSELSVALVADERFGGATRWAEAS